MEDLDAKQHELEEQQAAVNSIAKELETQKKALVAECTGLQNREREVRAMRKRLDALATVEPAMTAAMHTKSSTEDVVKHAVENAIRSDHMTASEIVQMALNTAVGINGRIHSDNLEDLLIDLIFDADSLKTAIQAAMHNFDVNPVVYHTLLIATRRGEASVHLKECINKTLAALRDEKVNAAEPSKKTQGSYYGFSPMTLNVLKLTLQCAAAPKENAPAVPQSQATRANINNGLRGQAADFKPAINAIPTCDTSSWQALAESGRGNGTSASGGW